MLIERTGPLEVVMVLEKNESDNEDFLITQAKELLKLDKKSGYKPEITMFCLEGRKLVFMKLHNTEKIFGFENSEDFIDAARQLGDMTDDCRVFQNKNMIYIKTGNPLAWALLSEYGECCGEKPGLRLVGDGETLKKLGGKR